MSNYRNRIGEAIAFARNVAGRSQQELADMLGRDKRTAAGVIRISFSPDNTNADVDALCAALKAHRDSRFPML